MSVGNLRDELGLRSGPEFDLELPAGWSRRVPDEATEQQMLSALKQRLMESHRPEMYAQAKAMLEESFSSMRRGNVIAFFSPTDPGEDSVFVPASLNATIRSAPAGQSLDGTIKTLVREYGATPLFGDKRTLRVEREKSVKVGTETMINHTVMYLSPVPGSHRRRALQLVAGFGRMPDMAADDELLQTIRFLFDTCVSTLRWQVQSAR